jgi:hypothetical protein
MTGAAAVPVGRPAREDRMTFPPLDIPLLRAAAWFGEDPRDPLLAPGSDGFLDLAWGEPDVAFVDRLQRRRLSPLARGFFHCARRVAPAGQARVVFASRHGEAERTLAVLQDLAQEVEVSPTQFSMSVHNSVPGLWSILTGNRASAGAVAAGAETFAWGLADALALYRADPSGPVLYGYADDRLPDPWADPVPRGFLHALALLVGEPAARRLGMGREPGPDAPEPAVPQSVHCLRALRGGDATTWAGPGGRWRWQIG